MKHLTPLTLLAALCAQTASADTYKTEVWADNWFTLSVNGEHVATDSVPITTERSFNAETFTFDAEPPFVIALTAKDFKENDTGLEYIGTRRQQMGDGGVIVQITKANGDLVAATDENWKCLVTHNAPAQKSCADESAPIAGSDTCASTTFDVPNGWDSLNFDDSAWSNANEYSEQAVRPKDGYNRISWHSAAKLIWGPDLETDNTVLCRMVVTQ